MVETVTAFFGFFSINVVMVRWLTGRTMSSKVKIKTKNIQGYSLGLVIRGRVMMCVQTMRHVIPDS
jgi:hypothetical protein